MIISNIGLCKQFMSRAGWSHFVGDMRNNTNGESFNALIEPNETEILLDRFEIARYEYDSSRCHRETDSSPYRYNTETNTVEQIDRNGDIISKHTPCPSEQWAWEQLVATK